MKYAALLFSLVTAHATVITFNAPSVSGTHNGVNYTFTGSGPAVVETLPDYAISSTLVGTLVVILNTQSPQDFTAPASFTLNGQNLTASLTFQFRPDVAPNYVMGFFAFNGPQPPVASLGGTYFAGFANGSPLPINIDIHDIPEPGAFALGGLGLLTMLGLRYRPRQSPSA